MIEKGIEIREQEVLDIHECEIRNETAREKALRKKLIARIKKDKQRLHSFKYLTRNVGKRRNDSLKKLHITNDNGEIVETVLDRNSIKEKIMNYNL